MSQKHFSSDNGRLHSDDLRICHNVLDAICRDIGIEPGSEEADRIAEITINVYQQGVRGTQLRHIVDAARGLNLHRYGPRA
jgi:hypothetical protein